MKLYPIGWFQAPSRSFQLFSSNGRDDQQHAVGVLPPDSDEMVHVDGKQVVWSAGSGGAQRVYKSYRQVLTAKQALLCSFVGVGTGDDVNSLGVTGDSAVGDVQPLGTTSQQDARRVSVENDQGGKREGHEDAHDDRCLCVLQGLECVKIYAPDGAEFEVALPCKAKRMWALPRGLLIERAESSRPTDESASDDDDDKHMSDNADMDSDTDSLSPMFFTLLHPLEELKPVSYTVSNREVAGFAPAEAPKTKDPSNMSFELAPEGDEDEDSSSLNGDEVVGEFMCDPKERILLVDSKLCVVVTFHEGDRTHSVWALLPASAMKNTSKVNSPSAPKHQQETLNEEDMLSFSGSESESEDDDDVIESEVFIHRVWTGKSENEAMADSVFVSHDSEGFPLICLLHTKSCELCALSVRTETKNSNAFPSPLVTAGSSLLATSIPSLVRSTHKERVVVELAFKLKARAAQPILSTGLPNVLDMIIVNEDGILELYRGQTRLCELEVAMDKLPPQNATKTDKSSTALSVANLEHAVSNRVNLVLDDGTVLRVSTAMSFQSSILRPCLEGIDSALPADVSLKLRVDVAYCYDLICHSEDSRVHRLARKLIGEEGIAKTGTRTDLEWAAFIIVVTLLLKESSDGEEEPAPRRSERAKATVAVAAPPVPPSHKNGWFERLLATDYHKEYEQFNRATLKHLPTSVPAPQETIADLRWFEALDDLPFQLIGDPEKFEQHLGVMVLALHLVYEELKLSTLTWPMTRPVAGLLGGLVSAAVHEPSASNYTDHYTRDLGTVEEIPFPHLPSNKRAKLAKQAPPDLLDWVGIRITKASGTYREKGDPAAAPMTARPEDVLLRNALGLNAASANIRSFPELDSCFRTQQLCCFVDLLSGGSGDEATVVPLEFRLNNDGKNTRATSKSPVVSAFMSVESSFSHWMSIHGYEASNPAERAVLGMVWFGFTLQDLETLTFGLSIPLREALHYCRSNPSGRWPADAYVLVGREDMAALALAPPPPTVTCFLNLEPRESRRHHHHHHNHGHHHGQGSDDPKLDLPAPSSISIMSPDTADSSSEMLPALKTPILSRVLQEESWSSAKLTTNTKGSGFRSVRSQGGSRTRKRPTDSINTVTTAVTPVWRRLPSGQHVANKFAEDLLWGGRAANSGLRHGSNTFLQHHQQRGQTTLNSTATNRLLSIADYAKLSASASAEVAAAQLGEDLFAADEEAISTSGAGHHGNEGGGGVDTEPGKGDRAVANVFDPSGFGLLQRMTSLRFGSDKRVREVCRLLRSSAPVRLVIERGPEMSDHELVAAQQAKLLLISRRTMALSVGRGMITYDTVRPLLTDTVDIPNISLAGKIPPNNAVVKLDLSGVSNGDEILSWPRFHNGAAAGLRLSAGRQVTPLTRTWIAYNRPETPNHTHAGFLFALGLQGHLAALTMADIYEYLAQGHDATTVAVMLGLAAAKRGTMAPTVSKMLCLHIPSLLPAAFSDMEVPATVQTAALMGVGLLYQGTAHRLMTEFLLAEIGRRPSSDRCVDRESYSLAAGLSLGLVTLGHGARPGGLSGLADLKLEDRLHRYMVGGLDPDYPASQANSNSASDATKCSRIREGPYVNVNVTSPGATLALAFIFLKSGNESVAARLSIPDTHFLLDYVRPDLLMLRLIARSLVLWDSVEPTEEWLLNQIPHAIRFSFERLAGGGTTAATVAAAHKMRAKHADMLDEDEELVDGHVEHDDDLDLSSSNSEHGENGEGHQGGDTSANDLSSATPAPPPLPSSPVRIRRRSASMGTTLPSAGGNRPRLKRRVHSMASMASRVTSVGEDSDGKPRRNTGMPVDEQAIRLAHANIVAGACMSIGLRFTGTACKPAQQVLIKYLKHFVRLRNTDRDHPFLAAQRPDKSTLEMCLGACAIALALVMAGTGDLETLRVLRSLRFKVDDSVSYGNHMAIGSAIGMLFLGGGRASFGNDNASIAALVCAFFPRFPLFTDDNQYHLQAMRHLYVLASEQRCLDAYDVDTRSPCYLPIEVTLCPNALSIYADRTTLEPSGDTALSEMHDSMRKGPHFAETASTTIKLVAPCLLPPIAWISAIRIDSPRYWPMDIQLGGEKNLTHRLAIAAYRVLCVKRKVGHLSYMEDPQGVSSLLARPRLKLIRSNSAIAERASADLMRSFTADPHVLAFANHFCSPPGADEGERERHFIEFCTATLYECLTHEKPEMLNAMVDLYQTSRVFQHAGHSFHIRNLKLLNCFYGGISTKEGQPENEPLVPPSFLASLNASMNKVVARFDRNPALLAHYLRKSSLPSVEDLALVMGQGYSPRNLQTLFVTYLHIHGIPTLHVVSTHDVASLTLAKAPLFSLQNAGALSPEALLKVVHALAAANH